MRKVRLLQFLYNDDNIIHCHQGSEAARVEWGSITAPYRDIDSAVAALTSTKKNLMLWPGEYTASAELDLPTTYGVNIIGMGNRSEIKLNIGASITNLFDLVPSGTSETTEYNFENVYIAQTEDNQVGVHLTRPSDNKCNVNFINCALEEDSGTAIKVDGAGDQTVRFTFQNCEVEGGLYWTIRNVQDRLWATDCEIMGLLTAYGDGTLQSMIQYDWCRVAHGACATSSFDSGSTPTFFSNYCIAETRTTDDSVWTEAKLDTSDLGSSKFTEQIIG